MASNVKMTGLKKLPLPGIGLFATCLLAIGLRLLPGIRIIDDAYITHRYTQNLLAGDGLI